MTCVNDCYLCKHEHELKDGWFWTCDAFPNGHPKDFNFSKVKEMTQCNNGIGFEPKEKNTETA